MKRRSFLKNSIFTGTILSVNACQLPDNGKNKSQFITDEFSLNEMTISDLRQAFNDNKLTSEKVVKLFQDRINTIDKQGPALNSVIEINPDGKFIKIANKSSDKVF